jgi:uncharacterized protein YbbC (DUF1343 family)
MKPGVQSGIDVLLEEKIDLLEGKRIGLITNHTGVTSSLEWTADVLHKHPKVNLTCLFGPEHGIRGDAQDLVKIGTSTDLRTGLPVFSLYGDDIKPTAEMTKGIDAFVFDIQEVGASYYTYIATMSKSMEAAAEHDKGFILLDRPNPITGVAVQGNVLEERYADLAGIRPVPIRYGMTMGELAQMFNREYDIECELTVVKARGWRREMWYDETALPWVTPSPNLPTLDTAVVYPGTCLFEGLNVSEGRGTTRPFEMVGAPWIDGFKLRERLTSEKLPGVMFRGLYFTPTFGKSAGEACGGIQLHVHDRRKFEPILTGLHTIKAIMDLFPGRLEFKKGWTRVDSTEETLPAVDFSFDLLAGTAAIREQLLDGVEPEDIKKGWAKDLKAFQAKRRKYLLYS